MPTIKTYSFCLAQIVRNEAEAEAKKIAEWLQIETAAKEGVGETEKFRYTFRRVGTNKVTLRVFPVWSREFSGEAYAEW